MEASGLSTSVPSAFSHVVTGGHTSYDSNPTSTEPEEGIIDVVNVTCIEPNQDGDEDQLLTRSSTPIKNTGTQPIVQNEVHFSTPVSDKCSASEFGPVCSPIVSSSFRPCPPLTPESSGYGSSSPRSSLRSNSPSSGASSGFYTRKPSLLDGASAGESSPKYSDSEQKSFPCNSSGSSHKHYLKNGRTTYTSAQVRVLEKAYCKDQYPEADTIEDLSREINVPCHKIKVWFQNKRARARRQVALPGMPGSIHPYTMSGMAAPNMAAIPFPLPPSSAMSQLPSLPQLPPFLPGHYNPYPFPSPYMSSAPMAPSIPFPDFGMYSYPAVQHMPYIFQTSPAQQEIDQLAMSYSNPTFSPC